MTRYFTLPIFIHFAKCFSCGAQLMYFGKVCPKKNMARCSKCRAASIRAMQQIQGGKSMCDLPTEAES